MGNEVAIREDSPEALIARAIDKNVPVDVMERLLAMRTQLKQEAAREAYFRELAEFQASCPAIPKTKHVKGKDGKLRYSYAPLEVIVGTIKDALKEHGFSYTLDAGEQTDTQVEAICVVHHVDGHSETSRFAVPIDAASFMNAPQRVASALTYAKRYAFCNALGIMTADEDDDANGASDEPGARDATRPTRLATEPTERKVHAGSKNQVKAQDKEEEPRWKALEETLKTALEREQIDKTSYDTWMGRVVARRGVLGAVEATVNDICGVKMVQGEIF